MSGQGHLRLGRMRIPLFLPVIGKPAFESAAAEEAQNCLMRNDSRTREYRLQPALPGPTTAAPIGRLASTLIELLLLHELADLYDFRRVCSVPYRRAVRLLEIPLQRF